VTQTLPSPTGRTEGARGRPWPEHELLVRALEGETAAWSEVIGRFEPLVRAIARSCGLTPVDAADVTQIVWLRLYEHGGAIRDAGGLGAWLATVTRRECIVMSRRTGREHPATDALTERASDHEVDDSLLSTERAAVVIGALEGASPRCRHLLRLLMVEQRPNYRQVAEHLDMPVGSIGPTRQRCLDCLRRQQAMLAWHESGRAEVAIDLRDHR
jgi:RNA polymerase sigma factor (sigma-70 family)